MNIYLTGSHGTGKTTVAKIVEQKTDFGTLPSVSRTSPFPQGTLENQKYVMQKISQRTKFHDQTIQERTPLDVFAYTMMMNIRSEYNSQNMEVERFIRSIEHSGEPLFYFPIAFAIEADGVRPGKWEQRQVDATIKGILDNSSVPYHVIPEGTPEERADFVLQEVRGHATI